MPTNVGSEALSALKVGESTVSKAYVGHTQIFPNSTEITALQLVSAHSANFNTSSTGAFPNSTSSAPGVSGGYIPRINVTGEIGSQFSVVGSGGGTFANGAHSSGIYTLVTSPQGFGWDQVANPGLASVGSNNSCDNPQRTITFTVSPQGSTTFASGVNGTLTLPQDPGPTTNNYTASPLSISATLTTPLASSKTTIGNTVYWVQGAAWNISWSFGGTYVTNASLGAFGSGTFGGTQPSGTSGSGTATWTQTSSQLSQVTFSIFVNSSGCNNATNSPAQVTKLGGQL